MSFLETPRFPDDISYGALSGPEYQTDVVVVNSGHESRNVNWEEARARFDVGHRGRNRAQTDTLIAFFRAVKGRGHGFRFKDWSDFSVAQADSVLTKISNGVYQLGRLYEAGAMSETREITKPVTVAVYRDGVASAAGAAAGQYALDTTTGRVTFVPDITRNISAVTKANPGVITTSVAHGLTTGQVVALASIGGMTQLNGIDVTVTVLSSTTFSIAVNTTSYTTYTSGGTVKKYIQAAEVLTWAGEFDVPCRFDTDRMQIEHISNGMYSWGQIPIIEIRV